jgi:putative spermidine/putrescine transport system ATP-binding protein
MVRAFGRPPRKPLPLPAPKLIIRELAKRYGSTAALEPTSLDVAEGEFLTLLGPSGSGKTTLLMMIAGLTDPSGGSLRINGQEMTHTPAFRRDIGVVFQNYALFPHLSVFENIAFPLRMRRLAEPAITKAVSDALALVRLPQLADRLPRQLSGGQQQRVAFARAIVFKPSLVLMDEPLGALDKKLRDELKLEIRRLHRELGATIVYVTHDQEEAMLLSDRICLMNNARVEQVDAPLALYERPATRFAATFLGESNILDGVVQDGGIDIGGFDVPTAHVNLLPPNGERVSAMIRPERVRLCGDGAGWSARIEGVIDLGSTRRIGLRLEDGPALEMIAMGGGPSPRAGDALRVTVAHEDVVPLAPETVR